MGYKPADASELDQIVSSSAAQKIKQKRRQSQDATPNDCWVLPENWPAVQLFLACQSCWRYAAMSGRVLGLGYTDVDVVIARGGFEPLATDDWQRLQLLEAVAKNELNRIADES
jgi:hypothetical protein